MVEGASQAERFHKIRSSFILDPVYLTAQEFTGIMFAIHSEWYSNIIEVDGSFMICFDQKENESNNKIRGISHLSIVQMKIEVAQ
eukprot:snap_masked-scaffold_40-processed-gene-0.47-mRNA-1 protein AED:1.00 eAED:1.00 QI:0/0/0/0/1/1/2/0/84